MDERPVPSELQPLVVAGEIRTEFDDSNAAREEAVVASRIDGPLHERGGSENSTRADSVGMLAFPHSVEHRVVVLAAAIAAG